MIELVRELVRYQFLYQSNVPVFPVENCRFGTGTSVFNKEKINIYFSSLLKPMYQFQNGSFQRRKLVHWTGTRTGTVPVHAPVQVSIWLTGPAAAAVMSARIGFRFCSRVHQRLPKRFLSVFPISWKNREKNLRIYRLNEWKAPCF